MIFKLWQWHINTVSGEQEIINAANESRRSRYDDACAIVAAGPPEPLTDIKQAAEHFCNTETGSVAAYDEDGNRLDWRWFE